MRPLSAATNIDTTDPANYPNGRLKDDAPGDAGTLLNEVLFGDLVSSIQKAVIDSSITENGLPDNETNGYQVLEALIKAINPVKSYDQTNVTAPGTGVMQSTTEFKILNSNGVKTLTGIISANTLDGTQTELKFTLTGVDVGLIWDSKFNDRLSSIMEIAGLDFIVTLKSGNVVSLRKLDGSQVAVSTATFAFNFNYF